MIGDVLGQNISKKNFWLRCDLNTIMRGLLSPNDMKEAMDRASTKKVFVARHI